METLQLKITDLPIAALDPNSPAPASQQIDADLRRMIREGAIPAGALLPPEMELCQAYGVGRQTVRQAIARLVDDNLVERFAGRGVFVRAVADRAHFYLDRSFSQQMRELGRQPSSRVLRLEAGQVDGEAPPALQRWKGEACLLLERLRFGDHEAICCQSTWLLTARCSGIERFDFNRQSLYEALAGKYHLMISRLDHTVRAVAADDYRAELLDVTPGTPLLYVGTAAYLEDGSLIEFTAAYYRADRYEYSTTQIWESG